MTRTLWSSSLLIVTCCVVVGCGATASMNMLNEGVTAGLKNSPDQIRIYVTREIGRDYTELGSVSVSMHGELDGKKYTRKMKEEAAKIGADAIVDYQQYGTSASGVAIKYKP